VQTFNRRNSRRPSAIEKLLTPIGNTEIEIVGCKDTKQKILFVLRSPFHSLDPFIAIAFFCVVTAFMKYQVNDDIAALLSSSKVSVAFLGGFLSFALVFRTNVCYSRWWEGRCLWGSLIYAAINTVQQGRCWISNEDQVQRLSSTVIVFAYACKAQLRGSSLSKEEGRKLIQKGFLSRAELDVVTTQSGWEPYYFLDVMRAVISQASLGEDNATNLMGRGVVAQLSLEKSIDTLARAIGGMIRVKATGIPATYNTFFTVSIYVFFLVATLAWAPSMGWYTPIVNALIYLVIRMFLILGDTLEDPFGLDIIDLPLHKYCEVIENQIDAVRSRRMVASFDLSIGPIDISPDSISQCSPKSTLILPTINSDENSTLKESKGSSEVDGVITADL